MITSNKQKCKINKLKVIFITLMIFFSALILQISHAIAPNIINATFLLLATYSKNLTFYYRM